LGKKLGRRIKDHTQVLLIGDLGSGKTVFARGMGEGLKIKERVKSPTYTLMNKYRVKRKNIYHYDLYRLEGKEGLDLMSLREDFADPRGVVIMEWADRLPARFYPEERIGVEFKFISVQAREVKIAFTREKTPSLKQVYQFWDQYLVPDNIRRHMQKVAQIAVSLAKKLIARGEIINIDLVRKSALLHDLLRIVTVKPQDLELSQSRIIKSQVNFWEKIRQQFCNLGHEEAASLVLAENGYKELAEIVRKHRMDVILQKNPFQTWEEKIVYYADKRVLHDQVVTLEERFADSLKRHHGGVTSEAREKMIELCYKLEKEIEGIVLFQPVS
jgi:tRNA threonylcarbamoyladenosine biosynthesis protein TsaE